MSAALTVVIAGALAALLGWYMIAVPGASHRGPLAPLSRDEIALAAALQDHITAIGSAEHNTRTPARLEAVAAYLEAQLQQQRHAVQAYPYDCGDGVVRNLEVVLAGRETGTIVIGAHYDSAIGAAGANDNGSGVAALLELARRFHGWRPRRTVRLAFFVNEEAPYFRSKAMGSRVYADALRARGDTVVAMFSLETIGYYSEAPRSQAYPFPLGFFYPDHGNFLAFVANLGSRRLLHRTIAAFRAEARFPSEGVAAPALVPGVDWSDQWSFWRHGIPAVMLTDTALYRYPYYHLPEDTPDKVDYARLARVVAGLERTFRTLAERL